MAKIRRFRFSLAACFALSLSASMHSHAAQTDAVDGPYVDASAYLQSDAQIDAWFGMTWALKRNFDQICGDSFCEGDHSNIEALRYRCSVHQTTGQIGMCVWIFAASNEEIDPITGKIKVQQAFWRCRTPLTAPTSIEELMAALGGNTPMYASLPGSDRSILDGLIDCL